MLLELKRLAYFGSDHFSMFIRSSYEPRRSFQQEARKPRQGEN